MQLNKNDPNAEFHEDENDQENKGNQPRFHYPELVNVANCPEPKFVSDTLLELGEVNQGIKVLQ